MMLKTTPPRSRRSLVLYVLPMIALALSAFATSEFQSASELIEQKVNAASNTFRLKGTVPDELNVDHYLVYINRYGQKGLPAPIDSVYVKDGKFEFSEEFDQPYSGMLRAVKKDGTLGEFFMEFFFVPGENCNINIQGEGLNEFALSGSKFYQDWTAFKNFYEKERQKAIDLKGAGDKAYYAAIADYNRKHKNEEGCIMYQYMWRYTGMDYSIADGIRNGRFKNYIEYRRVGHEKNDVSIGIHDNKLYLQKKGEDVYRQVNPKELMETLSQYKYEPTVLHIYSSGQEFSQLEHIAKEACRKNNLLKINVHKR